MLFLKLLLKSIYPINVCDSKGWQVSREQLGVLVKEPQEVTVEDINELTVRLEALSNILTIVMNALSQSDPSLHANIINNIEEFAESMRNSLGEVDEEDISAYAHSVADSMEEFLPLTEDEINSIEFMK